MAIVEVTKKDWEEAREQAKNILKQAEIMRIVNENLFKIAEMEISKFPEEKKEYAG